MHIHLQLFYSLLSSPKFPYICFGLLVDHLQGVTNYTYLASICLVAGADPEAIHNLCLILKIIL